VRQKWYPSKDCPRRGLMFHYDEETSIGFQERRQRLRAKLAA
jgi:hypothetical protein